MANLTAYGFARVQDLASQLITSQPNDVVQTAITASLAEYTRVIDELFAAVTVKTKPNQWQITYRLPSAHTLQTLDALGNPLPVIPGASYTVAFPIQGAGTAWGTDRISREKMTIADAEMFTVDAMLADRDWMRRHLLAAWFTNTTYTFSDPEHPTVTMTVQPLANNDTVTYVNRAGNMVTDNHFLFQAAAIADATNPYTTIYTELNEHPSNLGPYVAYIATDQVTTTKALANFIPVADPDVIEGSGIATLSGGFSPRFGDRVLGKVDGVWVVEWGVIPNGYILFHSSDANDAFGMREHDQTSLKGFFPEFADIDGNRKVSRMLRFCGFGAMNRIAAGVMLIGAGAYSIPTGQTAPLPR